MSWSPGNLPPAGWYPDPSGRAALRWWDGGAWSTSTLPSAPEAPPDPGPPSPGPPRPPPPPLGSPPPEPLPAGGEPAFPARAAWYGVAGVIVGFVLAGLLQGIGMLVFPGSGAAGILLGEMGLWIGFGGTCLVVSRQFGTGLIVDDFGLRWRPADIGYGPFAAAACLVTATSIGLAFRGSRLYGKNTDIITSQKSTVGVAIVTVIASVGAPVFEELFFRGLLRRAFASRIGIAGIWAQAVLFGLAHYQFGLGLRNVSVVSVTAGLGLVLGYTAHLTHRLGPAIIAHGLFNLYVTLTIIGVLQVRL